MPYLHAPEELGLLLPGEPAYRSDQLRRWLYETPVLSAEEMSNLPEAVRNTLADDLYPFTVEATHHGDRGRTVKWLFRTPTGAAIEAVAMGYARRTTLCISSQAGCAMACTFCATGQFGFERQLEAGEIVAQVAYAQAHLRKHPLRGAPQRIGNVVFMGMGEPLANYARVREALRRMVDTMGIGARSITVSTVGFVPGMLSLAEEPWQVGLAVSLHAADDDLRSQLVPLNERYPLGEVIAAAEHYQSNKGRRVSLEWTLMAGTNDTSGQAHKLAAIARRLGAHVNVINLNPTPLTRERPASLAAVRRFLDALTAAGANATLRDTRGRGIEAACGQLRSRQHEPSTPLPSPTLPAVE